MRRPNLIIGHVGSDSARIWVRGSVEYPAAFLMYAPANGTVVVSRRLLLEERHGYTGVIELSKLSASTRYKCEVSFGKTLNDPKAVRLFPSHNIGSFQTAPPEGSKSDLCFLFGSCNLHSLGIFSSPDPAFERIAELIRAEGVNFMLHIGDQIYADVPLPIITPSIELYRSKYIDAWGDSEPTSAVLTMIPHYMILDDHEIINDFSNDMDWQLGPLETLKIFGLKAYREFQHIHNPQTYGAESLYYNFSYGHNRFFVLDVRTERFQESPYNQMIGEEQLDDFLGWLKFYRNDPKFVVSSVPFVAEVRDLKDKWCSPPFRPQREQIIEFIAQNRIPNVIFLTGDMHSSYYATIEAINTDSHKTTIHELMSSPINQVTKSNPFVYKWDNKPIPIKVQDKQVVYKVNMNPALFYSKHSNVMCVRVRNNQVKFEIFRTKKTRGSDLSSTFPLIA